jgi:hypothetical protein
VRGWQVARIAQKLELFSEISNENDFEIAQQQKEFWRQILKVVPIGNSGVVHRNWLAGHWLQYSVSLAAKFGVSKRMVNLIKAGQRHAA